MIIERRRSVANVARGIHHPGSDEEHVTRDIWWGNGDKKGWDKLITWRDLWWNLTLALKYVQSSIFLRLPTPDATDVVGVECKVILYHLSSIDLPFNSKSVFHWSWLETSVTSALSDTMLQQWPRCSLETGVCISSDYPGADAGLSQRVLLLLSGLIL